jgi:hypothetical protein
MTRDDFLPGYQRLCRGHRFAATDERAEATYHAIGHFSALAWTDAVELLLLDNRMPSGERIIAAVDSATERRRRQAVAHAPLPLHILPSGASREYGQARLDVIKALLTKRLSKMDVPDTFLKIADRFPDHAGSLVHDAAEWAENPPGRRELPTSPPETETPSQTIIDWEGDDGLPF